MKEASSPFRGLPVGLRPTVNTGQGFQGLIEARNAKPTVRGLSSIDEPILLEAVDTSWPYPQIFHTGKEIYIALADSIYSYGTGALVLELGGLAPGEAWDNADFDLYSMFVNGLNTVIRDTATGVFSIFAGTSIPKMGTICRFGGQIIGGDIRSVWGDCDRGYVVWTDIGSANFDPDRKNEAGWAPTFMNRVYRVMKLGNRVVVYGDEGVKDMRPAGQTFGIFDVNEVGVASRRAMTGDDDNQFYVDKTGYLWKLSVNGAKSRLGYREFLSPLIDDDLVLSYDTAKKEVWICNETTGYILTEQGLGGPLSIPICDGVHIQPPGQTRAGFMVCMDPVLTQDYLTALTDSQDMAYRGQKTTGFIEVTQEGAAVVEIVVEFRYGSGTAYVSTGWQQCTVEDVGYHRVAGTDFRFGVRLSNYEKAVLTGLEYAWQLSDKRFIRGVRGLTDVKSDSGKAITG